MSTEDQCAVGPDGQLLDASQVQFFHDIDDKIPLPPIPSMQVVLSWLEVAIKSHCVSKPLLCLTNFNNVATSLCTSSNKQMAACSGLSSPDKADTLGLKVFLGAFLMTVLAAVLMTGKKVDYMCVLFWEIQHTYWIWANNLGTSFNCNSGQVRTGVPVIHAFVGRLSMLVTSVHASKAALFEGFRVKEDDLDGISLSLKWCTLVTLLLYSESSTVLCDPVCECIRAHSNVNWTCGQVYCTLSSMFRENIELSVASSSAFRKIFIELDRTKPVHH